MITLINFLSFLIRNNQKTPLLAIFQQTNSISRNIYWKSSLKNYISPCSTVELLNFLAGIDHSKKPCFLLFFDGWNKLNIFWIKFLKINHCDRGEFPCCFKGAAFTSGYLLLVGGINLKILNREVGYNPSFTGSVSSLIFLIQNCFKIVQPLY